MMERKKSLGIAIVLVILAIVPHWRTILLGELPLPEGYLAMLAKELQSQLRPTAWNALWWDGISQFLAWRTEAMRQLSEGQLPLWTNRIGCGFPFLANPQTQTLYLPTHLLSIGHWGLGIKNQHALLAAWNLKLMAFFHTLLAFVGVYLFIRSYGISRLASLVGAAVFGLGSFQIAWALLPTLPATAAWLPLTLWLLRRCVAGVQKGQWHWCLWLSLSVAMLLLAGHGQIALYGLLAVVLFAVMEITQSSQRWRIAFALVLSGGLVFLLSTAQFLPTMELMPLTHRHAPPSWEGYHAFVQRGLTITDWATMVLPFLFGNPIDGSYFGKESFADYCAYGGFGILVFALFGAGHWTLAKLQGFRASRLQGYVAISQQTPNSKFSHLFPFSPAPLHGCLLFVLGALLASGSTFNLPFYFTLPGFSQLGTPTRAVFLCQLALGMLAAIGLHKMQNAECRRQNGEGNMQKAVLALIMLASPLLGVALVVFALQQQFVTTPLEQQFATIEIVARNSGILAGIAAVLLAVISFVHHFQSPLFCYGIAVLLLAELSWFSAQQIPTARPEVVRQALQIADSALQAAVSDPQSPIPRPRRLLPLGVDWSLVSMPKTLLPPNSILLLRGEFADARNYDSLLLRHHKAVMAVFSKGNPCPLENGNMILLPKAVTNAKPLSRIVGADALLLPIDSGFAMQMTYTLRTFVPRSVRFAATIGEALQQLSDLPVSIATLAAKVDGERQMVVSPRLYRDQDAFICLFVDVRNGSDFAAPVWVVLSDTAYPGWQAFGLSEVGKWQPLPTTVANSAFRACRIISNMRHICWVYFPSSFAIGTFLSCVGVSFWVAWLVITLGRKDAGTQR